MILGPIQLSMIAFAIILGGAFIGVLLRRTLPGHHLDEHGKDVIRLGIGLIGTVAALSLGLLVASAKSSFDTQSNRVTGLAADIVLLDELLAQYGPETREARDLLRNTIDSTINRIWSSSAAPSKGVQLDASFVANPRLLELQPQTEPQLQVKAMAMRISADVARARLRLFVDDGVSVPMPFLAVLVFWLTIIFASFSLFSPLNPTTVVALTVVALSASCAIYLILDLARPFWGLIEVSSEPLRNALAPLGP